MVMGAYRGRGSSLSGRQEGEGETGRDWGPGITSKGMPPVTSSSQALPPKVFTTSPNSTTS
jgi:hypothetical protein